MTFDPGQLRRHASAAMLGFALTGFSFPASALPKAAPRGTRGPQLDEAGDTYTEDGRSAERLPAPPRPPMR